MRLPHLWLGPGDSLYDRLGDGFTLLAVAAEPAESTWQAAAQARGMPLHTLRINRPDTYPLFAARYLLVRPDHLVAWRGDEQPADPGSLLDHVRGAGPLGGIPPAGGSGFTDTESLPRSPS